MAEHLASIYCTEKDRVNCPFYFKVGACRHGDRCSRLHNVPTISPTLLLTNMYQHPNMIRRAAGGGGGKAELSNVQTQFEEFYEDIFEDLSKFGEIECLNVCDNLLDHMIGNVYVQFKEEEKAAAALKALPGRFYFGRPIIVEFSPVTNFREAACRQFEEGKCNYGYCNFVHVKQIGMDLQRRLMWPRCYYYRGRSRRPCYQRQHGDYLHEQDKRGRYPGHAKRIIRETSEERRARIAQWNEERDALF